MEMASSPLLNADNAFFQDKKLAIITTVTISKLSKGQCTKLCGPKIDVNSWHEQRWPRASSLRLETSPVVGLCI
ncbi:hypothetical protein V6N13_094464 [Hibiscus sabdariffa]